MKTKTIIGLVAVIILAFAGLYTSQARSLRQEVSAATASLATGSIVQGEGAIDTAGWTANEIMNYEMHGTIPARAQQRPTATQTQMVGGC